MVARLSQQRVDKFLSHASTFLSEEEVSFKLVQRLTGLMASAVDLVSLGRFHLRPFQKWMLSLNIPSCQGRTLVRVSERARTFLSPWLVPGFLRSGARLGAVIHRKVVTTDASLLGWGATLEGRTARGPWGPDLMNKHINYLELMAVFLALQEFEPFIRNCHVLIRTDNTVTMCYVNKQGGRRRALDVLARKVALWCSEHLQSVKASYVPGLLNSGADLLSRRKVRDEDWSLNQSVAFQIWTKYGHPVVDLFASREDAKCSLFFSLRGPAPLGIDAMAHDWPQGLLYAFPPMDLITPTLERVRRYGHELLLIAPRTGTWSSLIAPLLYRDPWQLPQIRDLLSQADREIFHPDPQRLDLWVWPVRGKG